jgi:CheY-like chemotaxis protein/HPt (histidine-containing phosphotransfer) domain-containing protein
MNKIALIEDNPDNRLLVRVMLESLYEVTEYETGFTALEGMPQARPDLVLLDISLPGMDGGEVLRRIREDSRLRQLPVIALTAHAMAGDREKYLCAGFDDYVAKPIVDEQVLLDAISRHLLESPTPATLAGPKAEPAEEAALDRLRRLGGDSFAAEMIDLFIGYSQTQLREARQALEAGERSALAKAVHPIKSSAANIGAEAVQELAASLEEAAGGRPAAELHRLFAELETAFAQVQPVLEGEKRKWGTPL